MKSRLSKKALRGPGARWVLASCLGAASLAPVTGQALEYQWDEINLVWDSSISLGAAWRAEGRDGDLIGISNGGRAYSTNGDDGNLAYSGGDPINAGMKYTADVSVNYRSVGLFIRGTYRYDHINEDKQFFNSENYQGAPFFTQNGDNLSDKRNDVRDEIGNNLDLLDAYIHGDFDLAGNSIGYKIGRQVLNWGESLFIPNGLNSIISANVNRLHAPGFELEELYEPAAMTVLNFDLSDTINVEAFYQWEWEKTVIDASGTYWASNDFAGIGGNAAEIGFGRCRENSAAGVCTFAPGGSAIPRGPDIEPDDGGQYGVAMHIFLPELNEMDLGIYAANYHSRLPLSSGNAVLVPGVAPSGRYSIEYPEDIQIYGLSFNTVVGDWSLQGEYSYKKDQPLQIDDVELFLAGLRAGFPSQVGSPGAGEFIQGWERFDVSQIDISTIRIFGPIEAIRSDQMILLIEVGAMQVHSMPSEDDLRLEGPGTYLPGNPVVAAAVGVPVQDGGYADATSWGYRVGVRLDYNNVFNRFTVEPSFMFAHDVHGTSPTPILNFVEDRKQLSSTLNIRYLSWEGGLSYTRYSGGEPFNLIADRDFFSVFMRYSW